MLPLVDHKLHNMATTEPKKDQQSEENEEKKARSNAFNTEPRIQNLMKSNIYMSRECPCNHHSNLNPDYPHRNVLGLSQMNVLDPYLFSRVRLPTFTGNLLEFPTFWAQYDALVHSKMTISGAEKFSILKSCLKGRALECIEGIPITSEDYYTAVDILCQTYNNPQILRHLIYTELANLPQCDSEGRQLQDFYLKMRRLVRQYNSITPDTTEYGLGALLYNKLPRFVQSRIYDVTDGQMNLTPGQLVDLLAEVVRKETTLMQLGNYANSYNSSPYSTGRTSASRDSGRTKDWISSTSCPFCLRANHSAIQCREYSTPEERRDRANQRELCIICLRGDHKPGSCERPACNFCSGKHHASLCYQTKQSENKVLPNRDNNPFTENISKSWPTKEKTKTYDKSRANYKQYNNHTTSENLINFSGETTEVTKEEIEKDKSTRQENDPCYSVASRTASVGKQDTSQSNSEEVLLMCTEITLTNPNDDKKRMRTLALLDSGSTHSYITNEVAEKLGLEPIKDKNITLNTFGNKESQTVHSKQYDINVLLVNDSIYQMEVQSLPFLTKPLPIPFNLPIATGGLNNNFSISTKNKATGILIGMDHFWQMILSEDFHSATLANGYNLLNTRLGKIISGKRVSTRTINMAVQDEDDHPLNKQNLDEMVERFWSCESLGTSDEGQGTSSEDNFCLDLFNKTTRYDEKECRYYTRLPFRSKREEVPENYRHCLACLKSNWRTLSKNPSHLEKYDNIIKEQLQRGIIKEVANQSTGLPGTYLPHHAVISGSKTTKIRLVYNGSAKVNKQPSLNDCLFRGPALIPDLSGILLRIRLAPILLIGDIEKAYHMIGLEECDRSFTKFLWLRNYRLPPSKENIITLQFQRVPFGLICSAFLLAATIHLHLTKTNTTLSHEILTSCYVDNIFLSANTKEQALNKYHETKNLFESAGMNVRQWTTSNSEVNAAITLKEETPTEETAKLLGIQWNVKKDTLILKIPQESGKPSVPTKRNILRQIASIFDPLGLIAPVTVEAKIFLQSLWKEDLQWDEILPDRFQSLWKNIMESWTHPIVEVPRRILPHDETPLSHQLHILTDASQSAYCAVAYIRTTTAERTNVQFLMGRTRLPPLKSTITIPRLELSAISLGSTLMKHIKKQVEIHFDEIYIWSDSKVALQWIKTKTKLPIFIQNRVQIIKNNAPDATLRHIPSLLNPADVGSRGSSINDLLRNELWWNGPSFLNQNCQQWPEDKSEELSPQKELVAVTVKDDEAPSNLRTVIENVSCYSSWKKLLNVVVKVLSFIFIIKQRVAKKKRLSLEIPDYIGKAKLVLFRQAQSTTPISEDQKKNLHAYFEEKTQLWRSKGRTSNSTLPFHMNNPIIIPRKNWITTLYVLHVHQENNHTGIAQTLTTLRQHVWIPQGRAEVKQVISKLCMYCKREKASPYCLPPFPDHPKERVQKPHYPFYNCGIDYAGPFRTTSNEEEGKVWIALFTCLNTRAIHIDVAKSLTANCFLQIFRRFISTHGCPHWMLSDNASTFTSVANLIPTNPKANNNITDYCAQHNIRFKFISAFAPWQGGLYESMIKIFKNSFKAAIKNRKLDIDEFLTLAKECEAITNSRPLTYVYSDTESGYPLRPIDFLRPFALLGSPRIQEEEESDEEWKSEIKRDDLQLRWKLTLDILNKFWKRWHKEYLTSMREHFQQEHNQPHSVSQKLPEENHIVIVHDAMKPRGQWKLAKIIKKSDHHATLKLADGQIITRPFNLLYPLELTISSDGKEEGREENIFPRSTARNEEIHNRSCQRTHPMVTRSMKKSEERKT